MPPVLPTASRKICAGGTPVSLSSAPSYDWIAKVTPSSRIQPATIETTIDITMPRGPAVAADLVSSVMWAEASNPVSVYCASSRPISAT